ncbi:hypothetical protein [Spiroplasma phoeniceum]|uniref:hypothetical protein n=1 Tax=Spiroplasma phoeniceum TaxID=47835 RepID=UPI0012493C6F|nr:hypothetical protein [Spiroplasma phoeniceum]
MKKKKKKWRIAKFKNSIKVNDSIIIDLQDNNRLRLGKFGHLMINSGGFFEVKPQDGILKKLNMFTVEMEEKSDRRY